MEQKHWSQVNLELAIAKLQEEPPQFGENGNTGERDGKWFALGYEVEKTDYDTFINKVHAALQGAVELKKEDLKEAA